MSQAKKIVLGISGASGAVYAQHLLDQLELAGCEIHLVVSVMAQQILLEEQSVAEITPMGFLARESSNITVHQINDMFSPLASGSFPVDAMVICPCSSHSMSSIANGMAGTLLLRSAYVALKQRRPLVLVHREMPLTEIDIENMLKITRAGGIICPASPNFYNEPETVSDLVATVTGRVLDLIGVSHDLDIRWGE